MIINLKLLRFRHAVSTLLLAIFALSFAGVSLAQNPDKSMIMALAAEPPANQLSTSTPLLPEQLQHEIDDLHALLEGKLPQHASLPTLFEINLGDEAAVSQRLENLRLRLATIEHSQAGAADDPNVLRVERDRLRYAFLSLPAEQRNDLRERDRLQRQGQMLATEQQESAAALEATEQARDSALEAARRASAGVERALANAEARQLTYLSELAALRQSWATEDQARLARYRELLARYAVVDSGEPLKPVQADVLYLEIREDLGRLRDEADKAIQAMSAVSLIVPLDGLLNLDDAAYASHAAAVEQLHQLSGRIARETAELRIRESTRRYHHAEQLMNVLRTLQARRVALLPLLPASRRAEMTGFNAEGFERLKGEVAHVGLILRWYPVQRLHDVQSFASLLHNVFTAGRFGMELAGFIFFLVMLFVARRHSFYWLGQLRAWLSTHVHPTALMLRVDRGMQLLIAVGYELILLLAVYFLFDQVLAARHDLPELDTLRKLAYLYAAYALTLAFIHRVLLVAVSRYQVVNAALNEKILKSLRQVARLVLFFGIYIILAKALLGRGALYGIAQDAAILGMVLVGWRLMRDWRSEVTQAYLDFFPTGWLSDRVRAGQGRSYGLLIATAAFVIVAAMGLWTWLSDIAMGFEQTRKALAYIFRRQLEIQSKRQVVETEAGPLPEILADAFAEVPASENVSIDIYPELPDVLTLIHELMHGQSGALIALTGDRGAGKTSWFMTLQRRLAQTAPCSLHTLDNRILQADDVCRWLCQALGIEATTDPDALIAQILQQPAQVVLIDLGQNLMLRAVGGLNAYEMFIRIAQATVGKVLWVIAFARLPFEYLQQTHPGHDVYDRVIYLDAWSETQISDLIDARMAAVGFTADYEQLRLNAATVSTSSMNTLAQTGAIERMMDRYHRLIWDYADGNPRVALHFFRLSLDWVRGTHVRVRLFPMPASSELEDFAARSRFVLACLVQHENLTVAEAAESLCFPLTECARALQLMHHRGILSCDESGRYRVTCHWIGAVTHFLKRKKLLVV